MQKRMTSIMRILEEVAAIDAEISHLRSNDIDFDKKMSRARARLSIANAKLRCLNTLKTCYEGLGKDKGKRAHEFYRCCILT